MQRLSLLLPLLLMLHGLRPAPHEHCTVRARSAFVPAGTAIAAGGTAEPTGHNTAHAPPIDGIARTLAAGGCTVAQRRPRWDEQTSDADAQWPRHPAIYGLKPLAGTVSLTSFTHSRRLSPADHEEDGPLERGAGRGAGGVRG